jgi:hypothetical protein
LPVGDSEGEEFDEFAAVVGVDQAAEFMGNGVK